MNDKRTRKRVRMTIFDLPSHGSFNVSFWLIATDPIIGKSYPPQGSFPGEHGNTEDKYIEVICVTFSMDIGLIASAQIVGAIIKALNLKKTIVRLSTLFPIWKQKLLIGMWCIDGRPDLLSNCYAERRRWIEYIWGQYTLMTAYKP